MQLIAFASLALAATAAAQHPVRAPKAARPAAAKTAALPKVDPKIPLYHKERDAAGNLNAVGSDTLNILMTYWAEAFRKIHASIRFQIEGKGSSTAPPALIAGTAQLGPMSRTMKPKEVDRFERRFGYPPTRVRVAVDALAVYVHRDNPLEKLSLPELDAIFSKTRRLGAPADLVRWDQLGLRDPRFAGKPIRIYGRNSASGTYGYFKKVALGKGDYKDTVKEQPGSASVVRSVATDLYGIGYSGIGYRTSGVKPLKLAVKPGGPYYGVDPASVYAGRYPLARFLYIYVNKRPGRELPPSVAEFLSFVLSRQGQALVVRAGYMPLPARILKRARKELGLE